MSTFKSDQKSSEMKQQLTEHIKMFMRHLARRRGPDKRTNAIYIYQLLFNIKITLSESEESFQEKLHEVAVKEIATLLRRLKTTRECFNCLLNRLKNIMEWHSAFETEDKQQPEQLPSIPKQSFSTPPTLTKKLEAYPNYRQKFEAYPVSRYQIHHYYPTFTEVKFTSTLPMRTARPIARDPAFDKNRARK